MESFGPIWSWTDTSRQSRLVLLAVGLSGVRRQSARSFTLNIGPRSIGLMCTRLILSTTSRTRG